MEGWRIRKCRESREEKGWANQTISLYINSNYNPQFPSIFSVSFTIIFFAFFLISKFLNFLIFVRFNIYNKQIVPKLNLNYTNQLLHNGFEQAY